MDNIGLMELAGIAGAIMAVVGLGAWLKKVADSTIKPIREMSAKLDKHNNALRSVLKNSITRTHREFTADGKIGRYTLQSALEMHEQYKALGGNSFVDEIVDELKKLPIDTGINR
jgi:hypothetical protein